MSKILWFLGGLFMLGVIVVGGIFVYNFLGGEGFIIPFVSGEQGSNGIDVWFTTGGGQRVEFTGLAIVQNIPDVEVVNTRTWVKNNYPIGIKVWLDSNVICESAQGTFTIPCPNKDVEYTLGAGATKEDNDWLCLANIDDWANANLVVGERANFDCKITINGEYESGGTIHPTNTLEPTFGIWVEKEEEVVTTTTVITTTTSSTSTTQPSLAPTSCTDFDGGKDYYVKGTITAGTVRGTTDYSSEDRCFGGTDVKEWYCASSNFADYEMYECPSGICQDGACVVAATTTTTLPVGGISGGIDYIESDCACYSTQTVNNLWLSGNINDQQWMDIVADCDSTGNVNDCEAYTTSLIQDPNICDWIC